jgi:hypothetical protein
MNRAPRTHSVGGERGFMTVQYVLAVGLSFVLLVLVGNLLVDLYARAAVRDALEEGTRAVVPIGALPRSCTERAQTVIKGLLHGPIGRDIRVRCTADAALATAVAEVRLPSWLPALAPDWRFTVRATATRDQ